MLLDFGRVHSGRARLRLADRGGACRRGGVAPRLARAGAAQAPAAARHRRRVAGGARRRASRAGDPDRLRRHRLPDAGAVVAGRPLPALRVSDGRRLAVRLRDVDRRGIGEDGERLADDPLPACDRRRDLVAPHTMVGVAGRPRRALAARRLRVGVQVRPSSGRVARGRARAGVQGAVRAGRRRARDRRGRQVDSGARDARARRLARVVANGVGRPCAMRPASSPPSSC